MARRNQHSLEEIKSMVLNAAESIIADEGFSALTIRKIAMEMGYTVGSVYMVFASRAELVLHLNARTLAELIEQLSIHGHLETWLNAYLDYIRTHRQRWQMIFMPSYDVSDNPLPDWYQSQLDTFFQQFAVYFPQVDNSQAVRALWLGMHGICLLASDEELDASIRSLLRMWHH